MVIPRGFEKRISLLITEKQKTNILAIYQSLGIV